MIIYFCDRQLNILGHATTVLPSGNRVSQDKTIEDVETGVNSFECVVAWDADTRRELENAIQAGNYVLKQSTDSNGYDSLYQIIETEADTLSQEIYLYAEDAGLDLINTICGAVTLTNRTITQMLSYFLPADWELNIQDAPTTTKTWIWDGDSTCTERIRSVVGLWDCELYYSFVIEGLQVKKKIINVVKKRGLQVAIPQLRLNYDIDRIVTKTSIASLVTALNVTGGTPDGSEVPINLVNYTYTYTDPVTGDVYKVDKATGQMRNITAMDRWSSVIDKDGLLVGSFTYETTDKAVLAGQARAELQKLSAPAVNYEVDFAQLPEDAQIGDRVNIIDDDGELYLEARLLLIETCEAEQTKVATIGEYLLKSSGISEKVLELAAQVKRQAESDQYIRDQIQILTETTASMLNLEVESNIVAGNAFLKAHLYNGGKEVTTDYSEALYKWIKRTEDGEFLLGRGYTLTVDLEEMGYAGTILCRFIRPVLYDLTDHLRVNITDQDGNNIQVAYAGVYSEPVIRRTKALRALNRASETNETGYPTLAREVNLYEREGLEKRLDPIVQHFWTDDDGAHITEVERDDFIHDPENGGGNLLARSDGIYIKEGINDLADFTSDGLKLYSTERLSAQFTPSYADFYTDEKQYTRISNDGFAIKNIGNNNGFDAQIKTNSIAYIYDDTYLGVGVDIGADRATLPNMRVGRLNLCTGGDSKIEMMSLNKNGVFNEFLSMEVGNAQLIFGDDYNLNYFRSDNGSSRAWFSVTSSSANMSVDLGVDSSGNNCGVKCDTGWIVKADNTYGVHMPLIPQSQSSSAGNTYVNNSGKLYQGTSSSERYKKDIQDIGGELDPAKLYDARVRQFKYRDDYLSTDDQRYGKDMGGFIVEELEKVYPIAVDYQDEQPEDWNYRYLLPPMLKLIQDQKKEIDELRERIEKLEGK